MPILFGIIFLAVMSIASPAFANPIILNPVSMLGGLILSLISEGIVLALLIGMKKTKPIKFMSMWFLVTLATWILFFLGISYFSGNHRNVPVLITGEVIVIILEAYILKVVVLSRKLMVESIKLSISKSLWFSLIANAVSLIIGLLALSISISLGHH